MKVTYLAGLQLFILVSRVIKKIVISEISPLALTRSSFKRVNEISRVCITPLE